MNHRVYYVGIRREPFPTLNLPTFALPNSIDAVLDPLGDWIRLNDRNWLCSTVHSSKELYEAIHQSLPQLDRIFVIALDPSERFGWAPQWVWDWIDSQREVTPRTVAEIVGARSSSSGVRDRREEAKVKEPAEG